MRYHTVGDSHALFGWPDYVIKHHIGAITCHRFGHDASDIINLRDMGVEAGDAVVFCFGEIDCRCHVHTHAVAHTAGFVGVIQTLVENYSAAIAKVVSAAEFELRVGVFNVLPPAAQIAAEVDPRFPVAGSAHDRKQYAQFFNEYARKLCAVNNYVFVDVYADYATQDGFLNPQLSDGHVHIQDGCYLTGALQQLSRGA